MDLDDIKNKLAGHKEQVDEGLDKAAAFAKDKVHGHDAQIDSGVKKAEEYLDKEN